MSSCVSYYTHHVPGGSTMDLPSHQRIEHDDDGETWNNGMAMENRITPHASFIVTNVVYIK